MSTNKQKLREALAQAGASFVLKPDTIWRSPRDNRRVVMASPTEQIEAEPSISLIGRQVVRSQDRYEQQGELVNIRKTANAISINRRRERKPTDNPGNRDVHHEQVRSHLV